MHHLLLNNSCERGGLSRDSGGESLTPIFNKELERNQKNYTLVGLISMVNASLQKLIKDEVTQQLEEFALV